jgi:hypothetical protein
MVTSFSPVQSWYNVQSYGGQPANEIQNGEEPQWQNARPSGVHGLFHVKPSTSSENLATKELKCDFSLQDSQN